MTEPTTPATYDAPAPDWLYVGAPVVFMYYGTGPTGQLIPTEVVKLTKRYIVLANGARFRHDSQRLRFADNEVFYMRNRPQDVAYLYAPDSHAVANHHTAQAKRELNDRVANAALGLSGGFVTHDRIDAMAAAIDQWRAANPTPTEPKN